MLRMKKIEEGWPTVEATRTSLSLLKSSPPLYLHKKMPQNISLHLGQRKYNIMAP